MYSPEGWPDNHLLHDALKPYWSSNSELSVVQNFLLKASLLPCVLRFGITSMKDTKESLNAESGPRALFGGQE